MAIGNLCVITVNGSAVTDWSGNPVPSVLDLSVVIAADVLILDYAPYMSGGDIRDLVAGWVFTPPPVTGILIAEPLGKEDGRDVVLQFPQLPDGTLVGRFPRYRWLVLPT